MDPVLLVDYANLPWNWIALAVALLVGILIIRTAMTLVKVAIVAAIAVGAWFVFTLVMGAFSGT